MPTLDPHVSLGLVDVTLLPVSNLSSHLRPTCCAVLYVTTAGGGIKRRWSTCSLDMGSSFNLGARQLGVGRWRLERRRKRGDLVVANEIAGQYEDNFNDIEAQMLNYFTQKAVRTVLHQLYEMNPPSYKWFYNYIAENELKDSQRFLRKLVKDNQGLGERVMITRLHLYGKWIKRCDHAKMYQFISDQNTDLMRERLMETVIWPSSTDDTNTVS